MLDWLLTLVRHQVWADAEHWRAILACSPASEDPVIRQRLHHIHLVQWAFLSACQGRQPKIQSVETFTDLSALCAYGRSYHAAVDAWLAKVTPDQLEDSVAIPWFDDPPLRLPVGQALTQAVMHSHYHRGQNATRLRSLGGEPPATDLIVWLWKGQPPAAWP